MRSAPIVLVAAAIALSCAASSPPLAPATPAPSSAEAPRPAGDLATPGPAAAPCTDDKACGAHRCNVAAGKCAFPCATDADCAQGAACNHGAVGLCVARP